MKKIKFALVGCGRIGQRHAEQIIKYGQLLAVCDISEHNALSVVKNLAGVKYYTDLSEMLESESGIDVVSICTPNGLHALHSIMCLNKGFHVLCEKPMAISSHDCGEMIKAAEKNNCRLFIIKQNRFNPPVVAVKEIIDNGILGKVYSIQLSCFWNRDEAYYENSWKGTIDFDGGTLFTQFSHFVDLLYWMFGDIKSVNSITKNYAHKGIIEFEDTGVSILEFSNGAIGTINYTVNSYGKNMEGSLTIFGEKGTVKIGGQYLNELEYQNIQDYKIENLIEGSRPNNYGTYVGSMSNHDKIYENLVAVLCNGASISTNAFEGLKTVEIIERIYQSSKNVT